MTFFWFVSNANCAENFKNLPQNCSCKNTKEGQNENIKNYSKNENFEQKNCKVNEKPNCKCEDDIEDDEYCVYNQCFFDKQYRQMKRFLCLTKRQENCIDNIYRNFKIDMEGMCEKYKCEKNKLLEIIECDKSCFRKQKNILKEIKYETKEKIKDYRNDIYDQLCKNQRKDFKKFQRYEMRKIKKLAKYCKVYKFPCVNCCKND